MNLKEKIEASRSAENRCHPKLRCVQMRIDDIEKDVLLAVQELKEEIEKQHITCVDCGEHIIKKLNEKFGVSELRRQE